MRIETAVLHTVARRMPRGCGGFEGEGIGERQVNDEKATRLRLASCNEQQKEETQAPHSHVLCHHYVGEQCLPHISGRLPARVARLGERLHDGIAEVAWHVAPQFPEIR